MISVLYIDDEPGLLDVGKLFLERYGEFRVETVASAQEALDIIREERFDAIISDYQMPIMNGIDLLRQIRASGDTIPFIIFTGRGREEVVIEALNEGVDFYLQKGGDPGSQFAELAHKVRQAVGQRRAEITIREHERREADILNFLPDATFAIDTSGMVIAWNRAIEKMTGVRSEEIVGKGDYEYAIPFYHERRPILIDLVIRDDPAIAEMYPAIRREGKKLISEIVIPHFNNGQGAALWFTASPLYDTHGNIIGAIESIREITERKRVEEALNDSERRFRELADLLPQVVYETDAEGRLTYANQIAFELFGYEEEDYRRGVTAQDIIATPDRKRAAEGICRIIEGEFVPQTSVEYTALRKDGSTFPVSIFSSPVYHSGKIIGIRGIVIDITDQKLAEKRIRNSEQNYRLLFENATEGILIAQDNRLVHINPALVNLLGRPQDDITSRPFADFIHPDDRGMVMTRHIQRVRGENPSTGYMFRIITGDGTEKWVRINSTRMIWSGKPATLSFLTDMTEQKRAEEDLVSANMEYTNLLDKIQDVYYRSDAQGRLIRASRSWATLLGYDNLSECLGRSIRDDFYFNPDHRDRLISQVLHDGKVTNYEVRLKKKDGTPMVVETSTHLYYDSSGNILGVEGTFHDITERKRQESILRIQLELGLALQNITGMHEKLEVCLDSAIRISGMDSGGIYLVDEEKGTIDLAISKNLGNEFIKSVSHFPPGSTNIKIVMRGVPLYFTYSELSAIDHGIYEQEGIRSIAIIPITFGDRSIACLNISSHTDVEIPEATHFVLETIATQISSAIERIKAEEAIAASEERYRNVVEDQTEFISRFLPDGTHIFVNDAYCRYFGFERDEIMGSRFKPDIPGKDRKSVNKFFESLTPDHPVGTIEHRIVMPDGKVRWLWWSDRAIFDPVGTLIEYQSVGRDITDMKEAEQALAESEAYYRSLAEVSTDLIFMIDRDDRVTYVNKFAAEMVGKPVSEIIGSERCSLFPPDISERQQKAIDRVFETGEQFKSSGQIDFPDGTCWFDHSLAPVRDAAGNITHVLGISRDVTDRKEAGVMIRSLVRLSDENPHPVFRLAADGTLLYANNPAKEWIKAVSGPGQELPERIRDLVSEALMKGGMHFAEVGIGFQQVYEVYAVRPEDEDYVNCYVSDITEWKREERTIRETNEKINLLTKITQHDVANQVTILKAIAQMALATQSDPAVIGIIEEMDKIGSAIYNQVEFTRAYQELGDHAPGWYSVRELVTAKKTQDIAIYCTCDAEIYGDPMLGKVFFNIIDNALRHGEHATKIDVSCKEVPDGLRIIIEDDGIGIPVENKEKIFEKGFGRNTGFGLFLAREILAITGISIHENGVSGKGARFDLHVPAGNYRMKR